MMHDKEYGPLSLVRVLNGTLKKGDKVTNTKSASESIQRIFEPLADEYREIHSVSVGNVGVCAGLKVWNLILLSIQITLISNASISSQNTSTGDLLVSNANSLKAAQKNFANSKFGDSKSTEKIFELSTTIPDAVYFCSIEPPSISYNLPLERALAQLQREDPSLRVHYDEATMQTVLSGMGELHLEIIKSRILTEYKIDADLGPLQIAYKETIREHARDTFHLKKDIGGSNQEVAFEMSLVNDKSELFNLDTHPDYRSALLAVWPKHLATVKKATRDAMARGPLVGGEVTNVQVILHSLVLSRGIADSFLASATIQCIRKVLNLIHSRII